MADDTNTAEREAADQWLRDRYGAYRGHFAWRELEEAFLAGRASLAASAGSAPVAWLVPHLHTFKGATKVHFTRAPGCTMTDAELMEDLEGRVMWLPSTFSDSPGVTDKFGVHHKPKPLYTHPSPPEGMAGWLNAEDMAALQRADECFDDGEGHDLPKARVDRLIELGVMRHNGGGYYSITSFGSFVLGCVHRHLPLETSAECCERLGREHRARISAPPLPASEEKEL